MSTVVNDKCANLEENKSNCPCTSTSCNNHGFCCKCIEHHKEKDNYPACLRYE